MTDEAATYIRETIAVFNHPDHERWWLCQVESPELDEAYERLDDLWRAVPTSDRKAVRDWMRMYTAGVVAGVRS